MATELTTTIRSAEPPGMTARRRTVAIWVALLGWLLYLGIAGATLLSEAAGHRASGNDVADALAFFVFASMGARLASKLPGNAVGWTLLVVALAAITERAIAGYVAAIAAGQDLPAPAFAAWIDSWIWGVSVGAAMVALPSVFPSGRRPEGRLGTYVRAMIALFAVAPVFFAIAPGPFLSLPAVTNPFGLALLEPIAATGRDVLPLLGVIPIVTCAVIPFIRFRSAGPVERAQLKWFAAAAALLATLLIANTLTSHALEIPLAVGIASVPAAIGIAVLRYRLYDIDVLISRTLVWIPLTALLGGGYAALVALLQRVFVNLTGDRSDAAVIISTLVLASLFTPVRRVLDTIVDARFRSSDARSTPSDPGAESPDIDDPAMTRRIEAIATRVVAEALAAERAAD